MTIKNVPPSNQILYMDVDGIIANLAPVWIGLYNHDYDDILTLEDMNDWDLHKLVKPECGYKIYNYLKSPSLYDEVKPFEGALEAMNQLKELGYRIIYATSTPLESAGRKYFWLKDWGFLKNRRDYIEITDKSLLRGRYMLDDAYHNVKTFMGYAYLWTRPWNENLKWYRRVSSWEEFLKIMKRNAFVDAGFIG